MLPILSNLAANVLLQEMKKKCPDKTAIPGVISFIQTAGDTLNLWKIFNINPIKCTNCGKEMKLAGLVITDCARQYKEILETNRFLYPP